MVSAPATRPWCIPTVASRSATGSRDVIISGGENISSVEVESALLRHDAVQEVSVVGMPHPKWGEVAHAFVVLRPRKTATGSRNRPIRA